MTAESKQSESGSESVCVCNVSNGSQDGAIMSLVQRLWCEGPLCARARVYFLPWSRERESTCKRHVCTGDFTATDTHTDRLCLHCSNHQSKAKLINQAPTICKTNVEPASEGALPWCPRVLLECPSSSPKWNKQGAPLFLTLLTCQCANIYILARPTWPGRLIRGLVTS